MMLSSLSNLIGSNVFLLLTTCFASLLLFFFSWFLLYKIQASFDHTVLHHIIYFTLTPSCIFIIRHVAPYSTFDSLLCKKKSYNLQILYATPFRLAYSCSLAGHSSTTNTFYWPQKRKYLGDISLNYTGQAGRYQNLSIQRLIVSDNSKNTSVPGDLICLIVNPL